MIDRDQNADPTSGEAIDIFKMVSDLWEQRWLVLSVVLICVAVAGAYLIYVEPIYEAKVSVQAPKISQVTGFNTGRDKGGGLAPFSPNDVYAVFKQRLISDESLGKFFKEYYFPAFHDSSVSEQSALYRRLINSFRIETRDKARPDRYTLTFLHTDPQQAAKWLMQYIQMVSNDASQDMLNNARSQLSMKADSVLHRIQIVKDAAKVRREDRIIRLKEALAIADEIGMDNPPVVTAQLQRQLSAVMEGELMYMRGSKALKAELNLLENRKSDDPFIPGLRDLEERYSRYTGVSVDMGAIAVSNLDGEIEASEQPVKPQVLPIMLLSIIAGFTVSICAVLASSALSRKRRN